MMAGQNDRKCCRICWNTKHWREPTGEAAKLEAEDSFVSRNRFGHEEWLFNFSWIHPSENSSSKGFKYGYLQPIGKYRTAYEGNALDILLYTLGPNKKRIAVAEISNLFVPPVKELKRAVAFMRKNRWLHEMMDDLGALGVSSSMLEEPAEHIFNVRFDPDQVTFFDPMIVLPETHKTYRSNRYQPLNWDGTSPLQNENTAIQVYGNRDGKRRSEEDRTRAAIEGVRYSPRHVKLQNALHDFFCKKYGKKSVYYERNFVDLALNVNNSLTYYEIKIAPTAKSCIREALGQLLEYGFYPNEQRCERLVIVGDGTATADDRAYIQYLRREFKLPVFYQCWSWQKGILLEAV
ncbi:hypothetical protein [Microvirga terrestris]|uniref:Restriction endonuclease n=1 Tax=Microvirga terrestris TaxID=2791024 RepID=A0ABS0HMF4_9HYPH|nr:hypothetical protein [Microvirga terrestris]MBF9194446.1 hypothetical protein [Microvirga terrestris]